MWIDTTFWCRDPGQERNCENKLRTMSKLKKKVKVRESHRVFVRKTIHEANDQIEKPEEPNTLKKLKSLRCTLQDKLSELKTLDNEILDLVDDVL